MVKDGVSALKKEAQRRKQVNRMLGDLCRNYYETLPIDKVGMILTKFGFDEKPLEGIYCGHQGRIHEKVGEYTYIVFQWYQMPSGWFEINSYVS